jgi:hypothetical protein
MIQQAEVECPVEKGVYAAYTSLNGPVIAREAYEIFNSKNRFIIKSDITVFGENGFYQNVFIELTNNWLPLNVKINDSSNNIFLADFSNSQATFTTRRSNASDIIHTVPILNSNFFITFSGALLIPFLWLRGLKPDSKKLSLQILPVGYAEVEVLENIMIFGESFKKLLLKQVANDTETIFYVIYDSTGVLQSVHHDNLIIRKIDA